MTATITFLGLFRITLHRLLHFLAFGLLAAVITLLSSRISHRLSGLGLVICFGCAIEVLQWLQSRNGLEFRDVRDDAVAALGGAILTEIYRFITNARTRANRECAVRHEANRD